MQNSQLNRFVVLTQVFGAVAGYEAGAKSVPVNFCKKPVRQKDIPDGKQDTPQKGNIGELAARYYCS